jgi:hypothetical protein
LSEQAERFRRGANAEALEAHAAQLGLTGASLQRLRIGWAGWAWSFPMTGADGRVCGIRLRSASALKCAIKGGKEGLFVSADLDASGTLAIAEGPTDTAALMDLGFAAVGRPNCSGGVRLLVALVKSRRPAAVAIFADTDGPGQRGAGNLATVLAIYCRDVRVVTPPAKDVRAWLAAGASPGDARELICAATPLRLAVHAERRRP